MGGGLLLELGIRRDSPSWVLRLWLLLLLMWAPVPVGLARITLLPVSHCGCPEAHADRWRSRTGFLLLVILHGCG